MKEVSTIHKPVYAMFNIELDDVQEIFIRGDRVFQC